MNAVPTSRPMVRAIEMLLRLPRRVLVEARILITRWNIHATERYLAACRVDGLIDSLAIREWRRELEADRVQLVILKGQR